VEEKIDFLNKIRQPCDSSREAIIDESLHRIRMLEEELAETRKVCFSYEEMFPLAFLNINCTNSQFPKMTTVPTIYYERALFW
jgi:hypothetical protein